VDFARHRWIGRRHGNELNDDEERKKHENESFEQTFHEESIVPPPPAGRMLPSCQTAAINRLCDRER
jgi:hypothetical protein